MAGALRCGAGGTRHAVRKRPQLQHGCRAGMVGVRPGRCGAVPGACRCAVLPYMAGGMRPARKRRLLGRASGSACGVQAAAVRRGGCEASGSSSVPMRMTQC